MAFALNATMTLVVSPAARVPWVAERSSHAAVFVTLQSSGAAFVLLRVYVRVSGVNGPPAKPVLLKSSDASWLTSSTTVEPNLRTYPETGFPGPPKDAPADKKGSQVMAVAVVGGFASGVAKPAKPDDKAGKDAAQARLIEHSPPDTRLVVFGSSAFVSDDVLSLAQQLDSDLAASNVELVHNAVDWSLADTDLLAIRSRNAAARALTIGPDSAGTWRNVNIAIALVGLVLVVGIAGLRRRAVRPITTAKEA